MDIPTQDTRGRGKNKRKWKYEEDAKLVEALLDMSHSTHVIWQNKPFPFYDDLLVIFGKDRATGNNAEGPTDMMEEIQREEVNNDPNNDVETTIENGLEDLDASMPFSPLQFPRTEGIQKKKKRSRSVDNLMIMTEGIKEAASVIGSEIAKASQLFSKAIGVEAEVSDKRQKIDSEIRKIPNLTATEVIKVVCRIAQNHELTDVFFSMSEEGREQLVLAILHGDI
ncbi:hypothetical protein Salat_1330200 [Sesamum alatum]|uniref:Uncharacterized protein n=1 Tax=Sesamum alatum TaxID=300844 RepID=A0AAE1YC52_9LAMI|nr:hypothetical protein Salat_1521300 [Sesamum alatum]KAK4430295.1 hypothetical protein Salat_1330200 [Sesamum alatum]